MQSRPHETLRQFDDFALIKSAQGVPYRQSLSHSIWRQESLVNKLIPNQSPWDFELDNQRAMFDGMDVYATKNRFAISCGHGYKKGKKLEKWYECTHPHITGKAGLSADDKKFIEDSGWMPEI